MKEKHILFTGDTESDREVEFMNKYTIDVDYLKVGHHGSYTSSSDLFIEHIQPEEVFMMCHRDNRYGHPNDVIVKRYLNRDIIVHRTDFDGTIEVSFFMGRVYKKHYKPG